METSTKAEKFCPHCGTALSADAAFCGNCGTKQVAEAAKPAAENLTPTVKPATAGTVKKTEAVAAAAPKKKMSKGVIIGIVAGVVAFFGLIAALLSFIYCNVIYTTLDMRDGIAVELTGLNGGAKANYSIAFSENPNDADAWDTLLEDAEIICAPEEGISNGDEVTVQVIANPEYLRAHRIRIKHAEFTVTAEGLEDGIPYDLFKDVKLTYTGVSPYLTVSVDDDACDEFIQDYVYFTIDNRYERKNGDTVTVTAEYSENRALEMKYAIASSTRTYTVAGPEYATSVDGLDMTALQTRIDEKLADKISNIDSGYFYLSGFGYVDSAASQGVYKRLLLTKNEAASRYETQNYYYAVYKYQVSGNRGNADMYMIAEVRDLAKNADGTAAWNENIGVYTYADYTAFTDDIASSRSGYTVHEVQ